jgi:hypothetical protein
LKKKSKDLVHDLPALLVDGLSPHQQQAQQLAQLKHDELCS